MILILLIGLCEILVSLLPLDVSSKAIAQVFLVVFSLYVNNKLNK